MPSNNCAVIGCDTKYTNKNIIRHRFPKDEKTCAIICEKHFDASCKSPGFKKLIHGSIPTLNLPGKALFLYSNILNI